MDASPKPAGNGDLVLPSGVAPLTPDDPATVGGHPLAGRLGTGGMGRVYLGRDPRGALVAVKVAHAYLADDEEVRARLRAEADCLRRVPAHCTAPLLVDGTGETPPHIVTEYIAGRSLKEVVERDGPLPPEQLRALAVGIARTLSLVHAAGLVHRDLKPANVLLTPTGPRLIDFGIAQEVDAAGGITRTGMVVGSVGWIAPERLTRNPATPASDVFGWGCLIAYAGTGRNPYGGGDAEDLARRTVLGSPDLDGLDLAVRPSVAAALARTPADRPSGSQLLMRLGATGTIAEGAPDRRTEPDPGIAPYRRAATLHALAWRTRPRRRVLIAASAASAAAIAAAAITWIPGGTADNATFPTDTATVQPGPRSSSPADSAAISREPERRKDDGARPAVGPAGGPRKPPGGKRGHGEKPGHGGKGRG